MSIRLFPVLNQLVHGPRTDQGTVQLNHRRIFILPTRRGLVFGLLLTLLLIGSINYALSLGFILTFLLVGLAHVAMLHTYRNLNGLRIQAGPTTPAFAGGTAYFGLQLQAATPRPALGLHFAGQAPIWVDLLDGSAQSAAVPLPATQRGWLAPGRITLVTKFPMGLFRGWSYVDFGARCLVYPQPLPTPLPSLGLAATAQGSETSRESGADDFAMLRDYRPGDPPRHVAWKASSKGDELLTKQFVAAASTTLWLDWYALGDADVETRLSRLCAQILEAERAQRPYGLRLPNREFPPNLGQAQRDQCLKALALFGSEHDQHA